MFGLPALLGASVVLVVYQFLLSFTYSRSLRRQTLLALLNLGVGLGACVMAKQVFGLGQSEVGLTSTTGAVLRWSLPIVALIGLGIWVVTSVPSIRRRFRDDRFASFTWPEVAWKVALITVGTAFVEELLFRGILMGAWRGASYSDVVAVVGSSLAFGLWHIGPEAAKLRGQQDATQKKWLPSISTAVLATTVLGGLLGLLRLASGSIWPCVLVHAAINSAGVVAARAASQDAKAPPSMR
ncbi:MAG: lysostaphin resistance A-like protein [Actinomycetota bacterium]